ncbi:MAG: TetR/AcrR family transcriptional regulator [Flavicella sp.]
MKKTAKKIADAARALFNKKGYSNVTVRMIAESLEMSAGNLNYHFKKREDILEAIYFEMVAVFDERVNTLGSQKITLNTIQNDIHTSIKRMVAYRFFWTDLYNILRSNDKINTHFAQAYENRKKGFLWLFDYLTEEGSIQAIPRNESELLSENMIGFGNTCLYNSFLYQDEIKQTDINSLTEKMLFLLHPYLTAKGKKAYEALSF